MSFEFKNSYKCDSTDDIRYKKADIKSPCFESTF